MDGWVDVGTWSGAFRIFAGVTKIVIAGGGGNIICFAWEVRVLDMRVCKRRSRWRECGGTKVYLGLGTGGWGAGDRELRGPGYWYLLIC